MVICEKIDEKTAAKGKIKKKYLDVSQNLYKFAAVNCDTKDNKYHNKDEENSVFRLHDGICNDG